MADLETRRVATSQHLAVSTLIQQSIELGPIDTCQDDEKQIRIDLMFASRLSMPESSRTLSPAVALGL